MFKPSLIEKLRKEIGSIESFIIVEGIKDKRALNQLGFKNVIDISGKSSFTLVDKIKSRNCDSVVILTDFDKDGEKKAKNLIKLFQINDIKVDLFPRNKIKRFFKMQKIEELNSFVKIMEDDYYGKTCSIYNKIFNRSRIFNRRNSRKARCYRGNIWSDGRFIGTRS